MARITKKQITEIARATKRMCNPEGRGNQVVVWPDGTWTEATGENDQVARLASDGSRTAPIARFRLPATRQSVREHLINYVDSHAKLYFINAAPAPWSLEESDGTVYVVDANKRHVAKIHARESSRDAPANACLIALSPEMAELLSDAATFLREGTPIHPGSDIATNILSLAKILGG